MDEKTLEVIQALADKLGTTAEHLWGVLVTQAPITGSVDLVVCIGMAWATVVWVKTVCRKTNAPPKTDEDRYPSADWRGEGAFVAWISVFIAASATAWTIAANASLIVAAFVNPEYWALRQLL